MMTSGKSMSNVSLTRHLPADKCNSWISLVLMQSSGQVRVPPSKAVPSLVLFYPGQQFRG